MIVREVILIDSRSKEIQASFQSHDKKVNTVSEWNISIF